MSEFPISTPNAGLAGIANGADGNLWFGEPDGNKVGRITPQGKVDEFPVPIPSCPPYWITRRPGRQHLVRGNPRVTKSAASHPERRNHRVRDPDPNPRPTGEHRGPDGNLWFTEQNANKIGRITPTGAITEFPLPTPWAAPSGITSGPDGNIWFTEKAANKIGRITPTGAIREWALPTPAAAPNKITSGLDGNIWFTEQGSSSIGRITP